ncbi:hypothetical protein F0U61_06450 [Archangium violaceum]|uniref:hypothetical protein n=1 Tax=Archangium violaceum TaxID=83451 RepID=UPI002B2DD4BB|nr:hypothetical protein F0U61_06450 [Archangium violaceum]
MLLTTAAVDHTRTLVANNRLAMLPKMVTGITLGAAFELACTRRLWEAEFNPAVEIAERWFEAYPDAEEVYHRLDGAAPRQPVPLFSSPRFEVERIVCREYLGTTGADAFQMRFRRSLVGNEFPNNLALALSKVFFEMADNVVQHSTEIEGEPALGIWGYHVESRWASFAVADVGRGVLRSLHSVPDYLGIRSAKEALDAAIRKHASRRVTLQPGHKGSFSTLDKRLADLNGVLRFRSDDARLMLDGRGGGYETTFANSAHLPGFQLVVICALDPKPTERPL